MKKYISFIIVSILIGLIFPFNAFSQYFDNKDQLDKKEKKAAREAYLNANFKAIDTLVQKRKFILEAYYLSDNHGSQVPVASNLNFILVNSDRTVLQTGVNGNYGYNGVGGVTAEGTINSWKVSKDEKRRSFTIRFNAITDNGVYDVILWIGADKKAKATITGMVSGSLTYTGNLVASYNSRVFQGTSR
ncbi:MAG TPA: DUF4251 domain-containing protein [Bacteroidales bacterium]|nr:DUF4251 domain-containing protein [Bacteroidales bacterium]